MEFEMALSSDSDNKNSKDQSESSVAGQETGAWFVRQGVVTEGFGLWA